MFNRYSLNLKPRPKTIQDILAEKFAAQSTAPSPTPNTPVFNPDPSQQIPATNPFASSMESADFGRPDKSPIEPPSNVEGQTFDYGESPFGKFKPQAPPIEQKEPSFVDKYNQANRNPHMDELIKLLQNQPNRDDYKPGWKDWVFSGLEGAGLAMAGNLPAGLGVINDARTEKYDRATEDYDRKVKNLTAIAGLGEKDVQRQLEGLKLGQDVMENERDFQLRKSEHDTRMKELEDKDWEKVTNEVNGKVQWVNRKTGGIIDGPQIGEPLAARTKREADIAQALAKARANEQSIAAKSRLDVVEARGKATADNLRARARALKPGDAAAKALNDVADITMEFGLGDEDINRLVTEDETTKRIIVNPDKNTDSATDRAIKEILRKRLQATYGGTETADQSTIPSNQSTVPGKKSAGTWTVEIIK